MNIEEFLKLLFPKTYDKLETVIELKNCKDVKRVLGNAYFYKLVKQGVIDKQTCYFSHEFITECLEALTLLAILIRPEKKDSFVKLYKEFVKTIKS
jgi:hypothetical protein